MLDLFSKPKFVSPFLVFFLVASLPRNGINSGNLVKNLNDQPRYSQTIDTASYMGHLYKPTRQLGNMSYCGKKHVISVISNSTVLQRKHIVSRSLQDSLFRPFLQRMCDDLVHVILEAVTTVLFSDILVMGAEAV